MLLVSRDENQASSGEARSAPGGRRECDPCAGGFRAVIAVVRAAAIRIRRIFWPSSNNDVNFLPTRRFAASNVQRLFESGEAMMQASRYCWVQLVLSIAALLAANASVAQVGDPVRGNTLYHTTYSCTGCHFGAVTASSEVRSAATVAGLLAAIDATG